MGENTITLKQDEFDAKVADKANDMIAKMSAVEFGKVYGVLADELTAAAKAEAVQGERDRAKALKEAFVDDAGVALDAVIAGTELMSAKADRADALAVELKELKAKLASGETPVGFSASDDQKPKDEVVGEKGGKDKPEAITKFENRVAEVMKAQGFTRQTEAMDFVVANEPELHEAYVAAQPVVVDRGRRGYRR